MFGLAFTCLTVLVTVAAAGGCSAPSNIVSETFSSAKQCFLDYSNDAYLYGCGVRNYITKYNFFLFQNQFLEDT